MPSLGGPCKFAGRGAFPGRTGFLRHSGRYGSLAGGSGTRLAVHAGRLLASQRGAGLCTGGHEACSLLGRRLAGERFARLERALLTFVDRLRYHAALAAALFDYGAPLLVATGRALA